MSFSKFPLSLATVIVALPLAVAAQPATADDVVILPAMEAVRMPALSLETAFQFRELQLDALEAAPASRLDEAIGLMPGATLFRRASSRSAHPTTQGLSFRQVGGNAAGRALVLLDGVPQNDPFGGWVNWSTMPAGLVQRATIRTGGGGTLFGPAALTGTLELDTMVLQQNSLQGMYGEDGLRSGYARLEGSAGSTSAMVFGGAARDPGYHVRPEADRGLVDSRAGVDSEMARVSINHEAGDIRLGASASWFSEDRTNDTAMEDNETRGRELAIRAAAGGSEEGWDALIYWQEREFSNIFTSVSDDRTTESPVVDQFHVPSEALGGSFRYRTLLGDIQTEFGTDARRVEGVNNEMARNLGSGFTRIREAGGESLFAGAYALAGTSVNALRLNAAIRADYWENTGGFSNEFDLADNSPISLRRFADTNGTELTGRVGAEYQLAEGFSVFSALYRSFRPPTLNELYRAYRVGDVITIENALLQPETLTGVDVGIRWTINPRLYGTTAVFVSRLDDAISNVTIGEGPGTFDPGGFVPAGGLLRQRQNLGAIDTIGLENNLTWQAHDSLRFDLNLLFTDSEVADAGSLTGKRPAQTPNYSGSLMSSWQVIEALELVGVVRWAGKSYEDDLNELPLASYGMIDAAAHWTVTETLQISLNIRNILNKEVQTGREPDGTLAIGEPRTVWMQARWLF